MWFKELYELWKGDNSLNQAVKDSHRMLEQTYGMFQESVKSLRKQDDRQVNLNVYEQDQVVNQYIREVRRKVLKYLAVTGGMNIIPGLILTSVVIDIERIGDYTKNITDLALAHPRKLEGGEFEADLRKIEQAVEDIFEQLLPALKSSDRNAAARLIDQHYWALKRSDEIVMSYIKEEHAGLTTRNVASLTLYARYLKRIAAHLLNIASSIVNPFEHIGFRSTDKPEVM